MLLQVHGDRSLQTKLTILQDDGVLVLSNAIHGTVKRPIKSDTRRLAAESRIVLASKARGLLLAEFGEFGAAVRLRTGTATGPAITATSARSAAGGRSLLSLLLAQGTQAHEPSTGSPRVGHDHLFGRPVTRYVRLSRRPSILPLRVRRHHRASHLRDRALSFHILSVPVHVASVRKLDGL